MLDRQKVETLLGRRFPGATAPQIAAAANAIMGLGDEWEEVPPGDDELGILTDVTPEFRVLRRRHAAVAAAR